MNRKMLITKATRFHVQLGKNALLHTWLISAKYLLCFSYPEMPLRPYVRQ